MKWAGWEVGTDSVSDQARTGNVPSKACTSDTPTDRATTIDRDTIARQRRSGRERLAARLNVGPKRGVRPVCSEVSLFPSAQKSLEKVDERRASSKPKTFYYILP